MSDMTLADALEKVQEWIGELVEALDPSVTIQRLDEPVKASTASTAPTTPCPATLGSNKCSRPAGHCGDHANAEMFWTDSEPTAEMFWTDSEPTPKWRELVEKNNKATDDPLSAVLYNMYAIEREGLPDSLARIVAVCEQQVPGWKAEPYNSDGFSVYRLVSAFGDGSSNDKTEPQSYDWMALGNEATSWLKHLTEDDEPLEQAERAGQGLDVEALISRAENAEAAIARVRELCDDFEHEENLNGGIGRYAVVRVDRVRSALNGERDE